MSTGAPTPAIQDYLKAIYRVEEEAGRFWVGTTEVAESLGVSAPSASAMLKRLADLGYVVAGERRGSFALGDGGRAVALEVIRHHRLLETFLVDHLGIPPSDVHRDAEVLEHHISETIEERIADVLGHPEFDPHGAPIPALPGDAIEDPDPVLADLDAGDRAVVRRVDERDRSLAAGLRRSGIVAGAQVEVIGVDRHGSVRTRVDGQEGEPVPAAAARAVRVSPTE